MGKFGTYVLFMSGIVLLFYFAGIITDTANTTFLTLLLNPESFRDSDLNIQVILVLEGVATAGILAIAVLTRNIELAVRGIFAIFLLNLLWDFIIVFNVIKSVNMPLAILIFGPLLLLYYVTIVEWWGKHD